MWVSASIRSCRSRKSLDVLDLQGPLAALSSPLSYFYAIFEGYLIHKMFLDIQISVHCDRKEYPNVHYTEKGAPIIQPAKRRFRRNLRQRITAVFRATATHSLPHNDKHKPIEQQSNPCRHMSTTAEKGSRYAVDAADGRQIAR